MKRYSYGFEMHGVGFILGLFIVSIIAGVIFGIISYAEESKVDFQTNSKSEMQEFLNDFDETEHESVQFTVIYD